VTLKLGRLAAQRPVGLQDFTAYLTNPLPAPPPSVSSPQLADWGMLGNDAYGDCTIAGVVHLRMANALERKEPDAFPTADQVVAEYFKLSGGADTGLVEANVLREWHAGGLFADKIAGYAPLDHRNIDELRSVVAKFGGSYLGVVIAAPAQQQFAAGKPWDLTGTAADNEIEGGHCVPVVGYDASYAWVVTWGRLQPVTWRWIGAYLEEAWAVLTSEDDRVDHASLEADLARIPGHI
jgi:hypothetical protein